MIGQEVYYISYTKGLEVLWKDVRDMYRICLVPTTNGWYKLYCFYIVSSVCVKDYWEHSSTEVRKVFEADVVDFDGVRHLEFNRNGIDTDGYLYYPNMDTLVEALSFVRDFATQKLKEWEGKI